MQRTRSSPRALGSLLIAVGLIATACGTAATPAPSSAATPGATPIQPTPQLVQVTAPPLPDSGPGPNGGTIVRWFIGLGTGGQPQPNTQPNTQPNQVNIFADPRVRVFITDQTIFTPDNVDRYPPDLETLVKGVDVLPITSGALNQRGNANVTALEAAQPDSSTIPKTKIYMRRIPIDPMTGKAEWNFRSCYDLSDSTSWGGENIFDVHSKSKGTSLNGEKYSDW